MKLLLQHTHAPGEIAGVLTYLDAIAPELNSRGVETPMISTKSTSFKEWISAIAQADLVHMNSNHPAFALLCRLLGKKVIVKYHYLFYSSTHFEYEKLSFLKRLQKEFIVTLPKAHLPLKWKLYTVVHWARMIARFFAASLANRHTACSQFMADSTSLPWQVSTLFNPISLPEQLSPKQLSTPYTFAYVGRVYGDKGVDLLLKAAQLLTEWNYSFQVIIIGDGQEMPKLKEYVETWQLSDRVQFLGSLPRAEILEQVRNALALVVPSRWQEPAGYVTLEASSVHTCSIVAKVGGLPEMAGPDSLMFEREDFRGLAEAMKACLDDPDSAIARGSRAADYVKENFSPEKVVDQLLEICNSL
jgi:glycogen synthase